MQTSLITIAWPFGFALTPDLEAILRMGLAVLCGLAVGLNRAHHGTISHPKIGRAHV